MNAEPSSGTSEIFRPHAQVEKPISTRLGCAERVLDAEVDGLVGQRREERALHVEAVAPGVRVVVQVLRLEVGPDRDRVRGRRPERAELGQVALGLGRASRSGAP